MRKFFSLLITMCMIHTLEVVAQSIVRNYPDNWKCENVGLDMTRVTSSPNVGEEAYVPPYYYAKYSTESRYGSAVVTYIEGHYLSNPWSGWMVKSPKDRRKVVPTNIIPDLNGGRPGAFTNCTKLKKIVLPPTINAIGYRAFENCNLNELICMAITPPTLDEEAFDKATIGKIVVPTGTLSTYKNTAGWKNFTLEEGAEKYSECQMVECNGAWYEVKNGEAALVNTDNLTDRVMPETVTCLINGQWKEVPVTSIRPWSVHYNMVLNSHITDIPENWRDYNSTPVFSVAENHPTLRSLAPNVISNKNGKIAHYIFNEATVPHGVTSIANNALKYSTTVYLPTTVTYIGSQSNRVTLYFTSEQPPSSAMSSYGGYAPKEYLEKYNNSGSGRFYDSGVPAGYEIVKTGSDVTYWNPKSGNAILKQYTATGDDVSVDGTVTLPAQYFLNEAVNGAIDTYDLTLNKKSDVANLNKIQIPEGVKHCMSITPYYNNGYQTEYNVNEIHLPSSLENCNLLSHIYGLRVIDINPNNPKLDSRDNCNAVIETATNTLLTACSTTTIPSSVEHIGENAFKGLSYAGNTISIPASVKTIGKHAFFNLWGNSPVQIEFAPESAITCIEDSVFYGANISSVNIPNSVERIGTRSFEGCSNLKDVSLGNALKEIGMSAFSVCSNLKEVTFGSSLKKIGDFAFRGCALTSLTFPDALEQIGEEAFYGIPTLESITFGKSLKEIGTNAFGSCGITTLTLPDALETIGNSAFSNSSALETIKFGKNLKEISSYAFSGCGIKAITLPDALEKINSYVFFNCKGMTSVSIGKSLKTIDNDAFNGCDALQKVIIKDLASWLNVTFGNNYANPLYYAGHLYSDENTEIKDLVIPSSMTTIGGESLKHCTGLTSVTIPSSVISIENGTFSGCTGLSSVTIDSNEIMANTAGGNNISYIFGTQVKKFIIGNNVTAIGDHAFDDCSGLKSISIPNSVTNIGGLAFCGCTSLASIDIPNSVISIGGRAFYGCGLKSVIIPNSVASIGFAAFQSCTALKSVTFSNSVSARNDNISGGNRNQQPTNSANNVTVGDYAFSECTSLTSIDLPDNITSIGERTFYNCTGLTTITIGNGLASIGKQAFDYCNKLETIKVAQGNTVYNSRNNCNAIIKTTTDELILGCKNTVIPDGVKVIGYCAFCGCTDLTSISIPNSVTTIGSSAFSVCPSLNSIEIPNSVTRIGSSAFSGCKSLTSIEIPNGVTLLQDGMFLGCTGLKSVSIPDVVTYIGSDAFRECSSLTSITIPNSVKSIGAQAFYGCSILTDVYCLAEDIPSLGENALYNANIDNATLHVPAASLSAYQETEPWSQFARIVPLTDEEMTGIVKVSADDHSKPKDSVIYGIDGRRLNQRQRGLNIIRMSDGTTKKVLVK